MTRPTCAHCGGTAREVSLWTDIVALRERGDVVCCRASI